MLGSGLEVLQEAIRNGKPRAFLLDSSIMPSDGWLIEYGYCH